MSMSWNIVNNTGEAFAAVEPRIRTKISKLEKHLAHFPSKSVHLHIAINRNQRRKTYIITLNLRMPSNVLHAQKASSSMVKAVDEAVNVLHRQLGRVMSAYRREPDRKRAARRQDGRREIAFAESPLPPGQGPQRAEDLVASVLRDNFRRALQLAEEQIKDYAADRTIPKRAVDARDVVGRAAQTVLQHPSLRPESMTLERWFLSLSVHQVRRAIRNYIKDEDKTVPLELEVEPRGAFALVEEHETGDSIEDAVWEKLDPAEISESDFIPDPEVEQPDSQADRQGILDAIRAMARSWPKAERDIFEMYFLQGFETGELGLLLGLKANAVERALVRIKERMRSSLSSLVRS